MQRQFAASILPVKSLEAAHRLVSYLEAASYAMLRCRILSTIVICTIVWLASLWLAAALAQAQESPSNELGLTLTRPAIAQSTIARMVANYLVVSMVDRSELERSALPNSAAQGIGPHHGTANVLLRPDPPWAEYGSVATLASAPSSSLLNTVQSKGGGHTDAASQAGDTRLVYQLGPINFVINGLPSSFSVSSAGSSVAAAR